MCGQLAISQQLGCGEQSMNWVARTLTSSIGGKIIVALSGLIAIGFVMGHLMGNMTIYAGPNAINTYAAGLHKIPALLWGARTVIICAFVIHVAVTLILNWQSTVARPIGYKKKGTIQASFASVTMVYTGVLLAAFLLFHLSHFTWRIGVFKEYESLIIVAGDLAGKMDVYHMVVLAFSDLWISVFYMVSMVVLGFHLSHSISALFQTLGLRHPKYNKFIDCVGPVIGVLLAVGNISIPLAVLTHLIS
jgi:succinate dehydrogenase / fumarate reductase, cytochrome b subunit